MSIVSLLLAVGGAVLAATLFIMFIAIIMAFTQINIPEKCKNAACALFLAALHSLKMKTALSKLTIPCVMAAVCA